MRPASSTPTSRCSVALPVSMSTSTTATWAPNGNVGWVAAKSDVPVIGLSRRAASSVQVIPTVGVPATWNLPA